MKTILILGAGFGQVPAIKKAKKLGFTVVCIDKNSKAQGMGLADYAYDIDIIDFDGALEIAKKHQVNGIMTMQSDLPVPTIGYINDQLGLTGVSQKAAVDCSNKIATRKRLAEQGCQQPKFKVVSDYQMAEVVAQEIGFPCVVKAPDSSGSRGVVKVESKESVRSAFDEAIRFSRGKEILVEEYIDGLEFGAQTFSVNGDCSVVLLHNDILSEPPYMIPVGHSFPFKYLNDEQRNLAIADIQKAVLALGIFDGPSNVDLILDEKDNRVKMIEIGARIGATCLPELVHYHTGIDWVEATILSALGNTPDLRINKNQPTAAFILQSPADGTFISCDQPYLDDPNLIDFEVTVQQGEKVTMLRKGTDRIGKVVCKGVTADDAENNVYNVMKKLNFKVDE